MDRVRKLELVQRMLGLRHKIKVHESQGGLPETHEDLAIHMLAKWEHEDEVRAIEELLAEDRMSNVSNKKKTINAEKGSLIKKKIYDDLPENTDASLSKKKTKK